MSLKTMISDLRSDSGVDRSELGRADSLRQNVLSHVVEENYDRAIRELKAFLEVDFEHPNFKGKIERYIHHAIDLVHAIRAKRKFPGMQMLTMARQQDLNEKFRTHFLELQYVLQKVEKIQRDVRLSDVRSTVWVVKALSIAVLVIALAAFLLDAHGGLVATVINVCEDIYQDISAWLLKKI